MKRLATAPAAVDVSLPSFTKCGSPMHPGVTISLFTISYLVGLLLEISRLFFRTPVRMLIISAVASLGLLLHTYHLYQQANFELRTGFVTPLSTWSDWCLMAGWLLAGAYLTLLLRRPENTLGIFLLPLVLTAIVLSAVFRDNPPFSQQQAFHYWRVVHGIALLVGTTSVFLGFATGLMYLVQSYRLKHKLPPRQGFRLPTLEWLQQFNREAILVSTLFLFVGLVSGIVINLSKRVVPWSDPVVLSSGGLFLWLTAASVFELLYRPAWQGRKVAYLTLASFVFLALVLMLVLTSEHAGTRPEPPSASSVITHGIAAKRLIEPVGARS